MPTRTVKLLCSEARWVAPLVAAAEPVKGIVVYGTVVRPFAEYLVAERRSKPKHLRQRSTIGRYHSMGSSARASGGGSMVRPGAFAILRLSPVEFGRLLHGQFAGLRPAQKLINEVCAASEG